MPVERASKSPDELALLRTMTADLTDAVALSVYNDYLEEHGDPRGPFLREYLRAFDAGDPLPPIPADFPPAWSEVLALPQRRRMRRKLGDFRADFLAVLRAASPCVRLGRGEPRPLDSFPVGTSRVGGLPDLPVGVDWPRRGLDEHAPRWPMQFLLQLDLADLRGTFADGLLPDAGLLSLFHTPDTAGTGRRLFYTPPIKPLRRMTAPSPYSPPPDYGSESVYDASVAFVLNFADGIDFRRHHIPGTEPTGRLYGICEGKFEEVYPHLFCVPVNEDRDCWWNTSAVARDHLCLFNLFDDDEARFAFVTGPYQVFASRADCRTGRFAEVAYRD